MPESERPILYDRRERIAWIRLNRPHRLNAVSEPLYEALEAAVADAEQDDGVRAIVVGGEGRAFCVGADLKAHRERERTAAERRAYAWAGQRACARLQDCPKPVVAAVNGYALGAGAEMALSCDFVVMAEEAEMGFPEVGLGTFLGGGLTYLLPKLVGLGKARELIMLGGRFTGRQAATLGLVMKAVPLAQLQVEAEALATALAGQAPLSLRFAKEQLNCHPRLDPKTAMTAEVDALVACMSTEDWKEGVRAFAEKRPPAFRGI